MNWIGTADGERGIQLSNEKRAPGCLGYIRDEINTIQFYERYFINHYKDPVFKQPGFNGK